MKGKLLRVRLAALAVTLVPGLAAVPQAMTSPAAAAAETVRVERPVGTEAAAFRDSTTAPTPAPAAALLTGAAAPVRFHEGRAGAALAGLSFELEGFDYGAPVEIDGVTTYAKPGLPTVRYSQSGDRLKEEVVVDRAQAASALRFKVDAPGLTWAPSGGGFTLHDRFGAPVYIVEAPFAIDAAGKRGEVTATRTADGLELRVAPAFVAAAAYPMTIDPTIDSVAGMTATDHANVRRTVKLADGTIVTAYADGTTIKFKTASAPYSTWSAPFTVGTGEDDFSMATNGVDTLYFLSRATTTASLEVRKVTRGTSWYGSPPSVLDSVPTQAASITQSQSGMLVATYHRNASASSHELWAQTSTDGGATWSSAMVATLAGAANAGTSAAIATSATIGVAYNDGTGQLKWSTRPVAGGTWSSPVALGGVNRDSFSIAYDGTATATLARHACAGCQIVSRTWTESTGSWSADTTLAATATDGPTVTTDGVNTWVFYTRDQGPLQSLFLFRKRSGPTLWGPETRWTGTQGPFDYVLEHVVPTLTNQEQNNNWTTQAANTTTNDVPFARNVNDELYLGATAPFDLVRFSLSTLSSANITPTFEYRGATGWLPLTVTDNTSGMLNSGVVTFSPPADWVKLGSTYQIRIIRRNLLVLQPPVASQITPMRHYRGLQSSERDASLLPVVWSQGNPAGTGYDVLFDGVDIGAPDAGWVAPILSGTVSGTVTAEAEVSDNYSGVKRLDFGYRVVFEDGSKGPWHTLASSTAAPHVLTWRTLSVPDGDVELGLNAEDNAGNSSGYGDLISVTVDNAVPLVSSFSPDVQFSGGDNLDMAVNRANGNLTTHVRGLGVAATGPAESVDLFYNSRNLGDSPVGRGWTWSMIDRLIVHANGDVTSVLGSGERDTYTSAGGGSYDRPAGTYRWLTKRGDGTYDLVDKAGVKRHFSASGNPLDVSDRNGRTRSYTYTSGRISSITNPSGGATSLGYDAAGRLETITDSAGRVTTLGHNAAGDLTSVSDNLQPTQPRSITFAYDGDHRMTSAVDSHNIETGKNKSWAITYASGNATFWAASVRNPNNATTTFDYGTVAQPNRRSSTDPVNVTTTLTVNSLGAVTAAADPGPVASSVSTSYTRDADQNVTTFVDGRGKSWGATFDASGNKLTETNPLSQTRTWTYNSLNKVLTYTDARNETWTYTYDSAGNRLTETTPLNRVTTATYDAAGNPETVVDPANKTWTSTYNSKGLVTSRTTPLGATASPSYSDTFGYNAAGQQITETDAAGHTTTTAYDAAGHVLSVTDPLGKKTTSTYGAGGHRLTSVEARGNEPGAVAADYRTTWDYDDGGRLASVTTPLGHKTEHTYDNASRITSSKDPLNNVTTFTYWPDGTPKTQVSPRGNVAGANAALFTTTWTYDAAGRQTQVTAPGGSSGVSTQSITKYGYDDAGRLTSEIAPRGNVTGAVASQFTTTRTYDAEGNELSVTNGLGNKSTATYDDEGRMVSSVNQEGNAAGGTPADHTMTITYNARGDIETQTQPDEAAMEYEYDDNGRQTIVTTPRGSVATYAYNPDDTLSSYTDGDGNVTTLTHDAAGRVASVVSARGNEPGATPSLFTTTYGYDAAGRLTSITRPGSAVQTTSYDRDGRRQGSSFPLVGGTFLQLDGNGNVLTATDVNSVPRSFTYDADGNRITARVGTGSNTTFAYDGAGRTTSVTYPASGPLGSPTTLTTGYDDAANITALTDPSGSLSWSYRSDNRMASETGPGGPTTFGYNANGNRTSVSTPQQSFGYTWTGNGRVATRTSGATTTASFQYSAAGDREATVFADGQVDEADWNLVGKVSAIRFRPSAAGAPVYERSVEYDADGLAVEETDGSAATTRAWQYNARGELTSETYATASGSETAAYGVDAAGRRTSKTVGAATVTYGYAVTGDRLTSKSSGVLSTSYSYDNEGRLTGSTGAEVSSYTWSNDGWLSSATKGLLTANLSYDSQGRLVQRATVGGATQRLRYNESRLDAVLDGSNNVTATFGYADDGTVLNATLAGGAAFDYHYDAFGSVAMITSTSGALAAQYDYDSTGRVTKEVHGPAWNATLASLPLRYRAAAGTLSFEDLGMYLVGGRWHDNELGRSFSADPAGGRLGCLATTGCSQGFSSTVGDATCPPTMAPPGASVSPNTPGGGGATLMGQNPAQCGGSGGGAWCWPAMDENKVIPKTTSTGRQTKTIPNGYVNFRPSNKTFTVEFAFHVTWKPCKVEWNARYWGTVYAPYTGYVVTMRSLMADGYFSDQSTRHFRNTPSNVFIAPSSSKDEYIALQKYDNPDRIRYPAAAGYQVCAQWNDAPQGGSTDMAYGGCTSAGHSETGDGHNRLHYYRMDLAGHQERPCGDLYNPRCYEGGAGSQYWGSRERK